MARRSFRIAPGFTVRIPSGGGRPRAGGNRYTDYERLEKSNKRQAEVDALSDLEHSLTSFHLEQFPITKPDPIATPPRINSSELAEQWAREAVQTVSLFRFLKRQELRLAAEQAAHHEADRLKQWNASEYQRLKLEREAEWQTLVSADPSNVRQLLVPALSKQRFRSKYFDLGDSPSQCVPLIVVLFEDLSLIPERYATLTPTGRPTVKQYTKTNRNSMYTKALGSFILGTAKRCFAAVPGVDNIQILVLRQEPDSSKLGAIYHATLNRFDTNALPFKTLDPSVEIMKVPDAVMARKGATAEVVSIAIENPKLIQVINSF